MCILFCSMHPAVLSSERHARVMRNVGSLVAHISVLRRGVFPLWIRYCYCVSCALSSFAIHLINSYWVINRYGNMSPRMGSILALGFAVLNIVRLTKEGIGENFFFHFSLPLLCEAVPCSLYGFRL